jgi:tetratricopeptide (TPR) repeat protein
MTEALIAELAQIHALRVISRFSAMHYKGTTKTLPEIARELGVDGIVEGAVLRDGDRVRITAQLIHAPSDRHVWARSYERDLRDVLRLQSEVARAIADEVQVTLAPKGRARSARAREVSSAANVDHRRSVDPEAYQLYLKGKYYWNTTTVNGLSKAIEYLQQAIERDPSYGLAYSWLANCYSMLGVNYRAPHEVFPKAKAAARQALALDSTVAEPHISMGAVQIFYDWDWPGAGHHLAQALALSPSHAYAHNLNAYYQELMGRPDAAMAAILRARELDPLAWVLSWDVGARHYMARQYARAIRQYQETLEFAPNRELASYGLWAAYEQLGEYDKALAELRMLTRTAEGTPSEHPPHTSMTRECYAAALRAELPQLQQLRDRRMLSTSDVAAIQVRLGEFDLACASLEKAYEDRDSRLPWITLDPRFDPLRGDARFEGLLRRMNVHP